MKIMVPLVTSLFLPVLAQASGECGNPDDVATKFMMAHLQQDAGKLYELTASSVRGDKGQFVAGYIDEHSTSSTYQEFWENNFEFAFSSVEVSSGVAKIDIESTYPDAMSVATRLAKDGEITQLETTADWDFLHDKMNEDGFSKVSREGKLHLLCEEKGWRVIRPKIVE
ncbi:hypothetical protein [Halomonas elongata]|uniref:Uncharacterized protein n=1 Tax=Halomonas elongata (strain ATCC 33173 / DSM 2581 / NBRC 15536 / NCIMB 2198 / 1H9) TaxID=768066 RepID=A0ABZ0T7L8_HALED|nr:hypothetical protein [Halomonas elongata]WBF17812.1 hypothetical protein LM502_17370 [Halomonas elongata]WPU46657.1 hypothetical protein SR933_15620 [Halomonas elongata DSM 2581]